MNISWKLLDLERGKAQFECLGRFGWFSNLMLSKLNECLMKTGCLTERTRLIWTLTHHSTEKEKQRKKMNEKNKIKYNS